MTDNNDPKTPPPPTPTETISARYLFSNEEKAELASRLVDATTRSAELEDQKKQVNSQFKAQLELEQSTINSLSGKYRAGYEMRPMECEIIVNHPLPGIKAYRSIATGGIVYQKTMTTEDYQTGLEL